MKLLDDLEDFWSFGSLLVHVNAFAEALLRHVESLNLRAGVCEDEQLVHCGFYPLRLTQNKGILESLRIVVKPVLSNTIAGY
jgi:hypothetical protein